MIHHNTSPHTEHMIYIFIKQELVKRVKGYGGRFLTKVSDGLWHEMDDGDARKKASQGKVNNPTGDADEWIVFDDSHLHFIFVLALREYKWG